MYAYLVRTERIVFEETHPAFRDVDGDGKSTRELFYGLPQGVVFRGPLKPYPSLHPVVSPTITRCSIRLSNSPPINLSVSPSVRGHYLFKCSTQYCLFVRATTANSTLFYVYLPYNGGPVTRHGWRPVTFSSRRRHVSLPRVVVTRRRHVSPSRVAEHSGCHFPNLDTNPCWCN